MQMVLFLSSVTYMNTCQLFLVTSYTLDTFFKFSSDLNQAAPNHLADESQTRYPDTPRTTMAS